MSRKYRKDIKHKREAKTGLPPGTPLYVGEDRTTKAIVNVYSFNNERLQIKENFEIRQLDTLSNHSITG